ncbi:MAG: WYL domain-containing protein [Clostridia bacterium]|nr:WYL domain-containing protein [Clostridia bacterium]
MRSLNNTEKIKFYVPERTDLVIRRDAEHFEIYKPNGTEVNLNRFLSMLIVGYYNSYKQERNETAEAIKETVAPYLRSNKQKEELTEQLMDHVILPEVSRRKGKQSIPMSLKPTYDTDPIITEINQSLVGTNDYISQYLRRMLMSYCEKPIYEREKIIFKEKVELLESACSSGRELSFSTTTNPQMIHHVIPYELTHGSEERFNYLLGQEYVEAFKQNMAVSYRLCRINRPSYGLSSGTLDEAIKQKLEKTKKCSPQYAINDETETCVRLSEKGQQSFQMIYFGRPTVSRKEKAEDGSMLYYFQSSTDQVYRYFIRFNAGEAEVLYPEQLRDNLRKFYEAAFRVYKSKNG